MLKEKQYGPFSTFQIGCALIAVLFLMALVGSVGFWPTILLLGFVTAMAVGLVYGKPGLAAAFKDEQKIPPEKD